VTPFVFDLTGDPPGALPEHPTQHSIGSAERVACYAARAERGEALHHPEDSRVVVEPPDNRRGNRVGHAKRVHSGGER